jgi:hypothetical protein
MTMLLTPCQAAVEFDGVNDSISVNHNLIQNLTVSGHTVSIWVKINSGTGTVRDLISKDGEAAGTREWLITASSSNNFRAHVWSNTDSSVFIDSLLTITNGIWYHVAQTWDGINLILYINGVEDIRVPAAIIGKNTTQPIRIGGGAQLGSTQYHSPCSIDDARIYNRPLTATEINALYNSRSKRPSGSLSNGLVAHYEMDDDAIGEVTAQAKDSSGNLNHGQFFGFDNIVSNGFSNDIPAQIGTGTSLKFDGNNDFVEADVDFSGTDAITTSFWFNKPGSSGIKAILELSSNFNSNNDGFVFSVDETGGPCTGYGVTIGLRGNAGYNLACRSAAAPLNQWHHYLGIFDKGASAANETQLYIDGVLQIVDRPVGFSNENTNNFANDTLYFMSRGGVGLFNRGLLDDVRVYDKALSQTEINYLYNGSGMDPGTSNLQALWTFDDDSAVKDSSGNDNHGVGRGGDSLKYTEGILRR